MAPRNYQPSSPQSVVSRRYSKIAAREVERLQVFTGHDAAFYRRVGEQNLLSPGVQEPLFDRIAVTSRYLGVSERRALELEEGDVPATQEALAERDDAEPIFVNSNAERKHLSERLHTNMGDFIELAVTKEMRVSRFRDLKIGEVTDLAWQVILPMHHEVLEAILQGDLLKKAKAGTNQVLMDALKRLQKAAKSRQPGIYALYVTDKDGNAPTILQTLQIITAMKEAIDNPTHPYHQYFLDSIHDSERAAKAKVGIFINAVKARIQTIPDQDMNKPLPTPFVDIGYSATVSDRLQAHMRGTSSNYMLHFFLKIARALFGEDSFEQYQTPVMQITSWWTAEVAEIFITRLAQGYIGNGGGFVYAYAGHSVHSRDTFDQADWTRFYELVKPRIDANIERIKEHFDTISKRNESTLVKLRQEQKELKAKITALEKARDESEQKEPLQDLIKDVNNRYKRWIEPAQSFHDRVVALHARAKGIKARHEARKRIRELTERRGSPDTTDSPVHSSSLPAMPDDEDELYRRD